MFSRTRRPLPILIALLAALPLPAFALTQSGTFTNPAGGSWSSFSNWSAFTIAQGIDANASFSSLNLTADATVTLAAPWTIGSMSFADTTPSNNWTLSDNNNAANTMTLAVSAGTPTITVSNQTATMNVALAGNQGLWKAGAGTLVLARNNSLTGNTLLAAGTLVCNTINAIANGSLTVSAGAALDLNATFQSVTDFSGTGPILNSSAGLAVLVLSNNGLSTLSNPVSGNVGIQTVGSGTLTIAAPIASSFNLTMNNGGRVICGGDNFLPTATSLNLFSGILDANGHNLQIASFLHAGTVTNSSTTPASLTLTASGLVATSFTGNLSFAKQGTGTLTLGTPATYTGSTSVFAGTFACNVDNALPTSTNLTVAPGATLAFNGHSQTVASIAGTGAVDPSTGGALAIAGSGISTFSLAGLNTPAVSLANVGSGTLALASPLGSAFLSAGAGTVRCDADFVLPSGAYHVTVQSGARLDLNGHSQATDLLAQNGLVTNSSNTPAILTISNTITDGIYNPITGNLSLVKTGPGILGFFSSESYTGSTTIQNGTLALVYANSLPLTTPLALGPSGVFELQGLAQEVASLSGAGTITSSIGGAVGTLTINNSSFASTAATLLTGSLSLTKLGAATLTLLTPATYTGNTTLAEGTFANGVSNAIPTSSPLILNPGATFDLNGFSQSLASLAGAGTITSSSPGATLTLASSSDTLLYTAFTADLTLVTYTSPGTLILRAPVTIAGSIVIPAGTLRLNTSGNPASRAASLTLAGGTNNWLSKLDLTTNPLILQPTPAAKSAAFATLLNQLTFAKNNGAWNRPGITSSTVAANPSQLTVGLFDNADLNLPSYLGQPLDTNSLLLIPTQIGDANADHTVDLADYDLWYKHVGGPANATSKGDFNLDNQIDLADYDAWYTHVGAAFPLAPQSSSFTPSSVPEPTTLFLFAAFPLLLKRRPSHNRLSLPPTHRR